MSLRCQGITLRGTQCKLYVQKNNEYCWRHIQSKQTKNTTTKNTTTKNTTTKDKTTKTKNNIRNNAKTNTMTNTTTNTIKHRKEANEINQHLISIFSGRQTKKPIRGGKTHNPFGDKEDEYNENDENDKQPKKKWKTYEFKDENEFRLQEEVKNWPKVRNQLISSKAFQLLHDTKHIEPIARLYIIDACLSKKYNTITLSQCLTQWNKEIEFATQLDIEVKTYQTKNPQIARFFIACRFAIGMLKHILFRNSNSTQINYYANATNFIVGLLESKQCQCMAYTMYVTSFVNMFGYDDIVQDCIVPGHIFNYMEIKNNTPSSKQTSFFAIAVDAGYEENSEIRLSFFGKAPKSESEIFKDIGWDEKLFNTDHLWGEEQPQCRRDSYFGHQTSRLARLTGTLFHEANIKHHFETAVRNQFIIESIADEEFEKWKYHNTKTIEMERFRISLLYAKVATIAQVLEYQGLNALFNTDVISAGGSSNAVSTNMNLVEKAYELKNIVFNKNQIQKPNFGHWDRSLLVSSFLYKLVKVRKNEFNEKNIKVFCDINDSYLHLLNNLQPNIRQYAFSYIYSSISDIIDFTITVRNRGRTVNSLFQILRVNITQPETQNLSRLPKSQYVLYIQSSDMMKNNDLVKSMKKHAKKSIEVSDWNPGYVFITYENQNTISKIKRGAKISV